MIDGYTHNSTLTSGDSVPHGTQLILVCRVVGLPYGTPLSYTWTCPNEPCEVEGFYGRRIYNEHILAVNTSSMHDGGEYTCQVTAAGTSAQTTTGSFTFSITGTSDIIRTCMHACIMSWMYCTTAVMVQALHLSFTHIQVVVLSTAMGDSYLIISQ